MMRLKISSLFTIAISTLFLFLFFGNANAQSSSSIHDFYSPQIYYPDVYSSQTDNSSIYTPESAQSNIYTLNEDLVDFHHSSLYESIHSEESNSNNSLLIVVDSQGDIISIIRLNNEAENKQQNDQNK